MIRFFDILISLPILLLVSPIFIFIAALIKLDSAGPIFFRQKRVGLNEKIFNVVKFRTMEKNAESQGLRITSRCDSRITKIGAILRKWKIDEVPQFINVIKGQMSIVGPRPEVPEYLHYYPKKIRKKIFSVKPGITDLVSLSLLDEESILAKYQDKQSAYIQYILPIKIKYQAVGVDNKNCIMYLLILFFTAQKIFLKK